MKIPILFIEFYSVSGAVTGLLTEIAYINARHGSEYTCIVVGSRGSLLEENRHHLHYTFYAIDAPELSGLYDEPLHTCTRYIRALTKIISIIRRHNIKLIHCNHYVWSPYATVAGRLFGLPVVIHLKDIVLLRPKIAGILMKWYSSTRYIAVSAFTRKFFVERHRIDPRKTIMLYDGIDETVFTPLGRQSFIRKQQAKIKIIIMMSRPVPERDIEVFIDCAAHLAARHPHLRFVHYGMHSPSLQAEYMRTLKERVNTLGIRNIFTFHPYISDAQRIAHLYRRAYLSLVTARQFALPNAAIESMMCGTPVIARDIGGNSEVIVNNNVGILIPSGSPILFARAIEEYLSDSHLYVSTAVRASDWARRTFQASSQYRKIVSLYRRML